MKINHDQLPGQLQRGLLPLYVITGDEPLLIQESVQQIREHARSQGFAMRETYHIENRFNWQDVLMSANSLSLFADRKLIELHFRNGKFNEADTNALNELVSFLNPDLLAIITLPRLESGVNKNKLWKRLDDTGATITIWPVERHNMPRWIQQRLQQHQLNATPEAIQFLADNTEGNLLAAKQEIEKLYLLADQSTIDLETMAQIVSNSSRYTVFNYVDRCLAGDGVQAIKTLQGLRSEGNDATLILWGISRELRLLHRLQFAESQGTPISQALRNERVPDMRHRLIQQAYSRVNKTVLNRLFEKARIIDSCIKGLKNDSPWLHFEQLTLTLCQRS